MTIAEAIAASARPRAWIERGFWAKGERRGECLVWTGSKTAKGYGLFRLPGLRQSFRAHRVAYFLATGEDPGDSLVCHACDTPACVEPKHLWLGDATDNNRDAIAKGRREACVMVRYWREINTRPVCPGWLVFSDDHRVPCSRPVWKGGCCDVHAAGLELDMRRLAR